MKTFTPEIEQDICDSYLKGESFPSLERRYEAFYTDINDVLTKYKIPHREMGALKKVLVGQESQVIAAYQTGISLRKLATKFGADRDVIKRILKENGTTLRNINESNQKKIFNKARVIALQKQGWSMEKIGKEVGVAPATVLECLRKNSEYKSDPKWKGRSVQISEETFVQIIDLYINHEWSLCRILKYFGLKTGHSGLSKYLRRRGITIRTGAAQNRKYFCKSDYFADPHSPAKYWILGFIATDGYIHEEKGCLSIEIDRGDIAALEFIKKELEFTGPIGFNKNHKSVILNIRDRKLVNDIVKLGIHQRKSLTLQPMEWIKNDLFHHFLNGIIAGDGWITFRRRYPKSQTQKTYILNVGFCGSSKFIVDIAKRVEEKWKISLFHHERKDGHHNYETNKRGTVLPICNDMFADPPFVLKRKHDAYLQYLKYLKELPV